jgi:protein O-mannosyl-transferase
VLSDSRRENLSRVEQEPSPFPIAAGAFAAALAGIVYLNALDNPFVYDDYRIVVHNTTIRQLFDLRTIVSGDITRPVVNLSYAIDRAVWGEAPFGFHVTNVLLHVVNTLLLHRLTLRLMQDAHRYGVELSAAIRPSVAAFIAAVLFAVHPISTEAVGYISGRSELLCAAFVLSALLSARHWFLTAGLGWWLLTIVFWAGALGSKEVAVMFPFVLLLYDRLVMAADATTRRRRLLRVHAAVIGLALAIGGTRLVVLLFIEHPVRLPVHWSLLLVNLDVVRRYLALIMMPSGQTLSHAVPATTLQQARGWAAVAVPAAMAGLAWWSRRAHGGVSIGLWWFLLMLVPSAVLVMFDRGEPMAEHRVYLACCGLFMAVGIGAAWVQARFAAVRVRSFDRAAKIAFGVIVLSLSTRTVVRNVVWGNEIGLWEEARSLAPDHWLPHLMLGQALDSAGHGLDAVPEYVEALRLRPEEELIYRKLGVSLIGLQRYGEAAALFEQLRDRTPRSATPSLGFAAIAMAQQDLDGAHGHLLEALARDASNVEARQSLALLAEAEPANPAEALRLCREIHELAPATPGNNECIVRNATRLANGRP